MIELLRKSLWKYYQNFETDFLMLKIGRGDYSVCESTLFENMILMKIKFKIGIEQAFEAISACSFSCLPLSIS